MQTLHLDKIEDLKLVYEGIAEDLRDIDYKPFISQELNRLADLHKSFFDSSTGPDGAAWKPNAPSTIRQKGHSTILRGIRGGNRKTARGVRPLKANKTRWIRGYRLATSLTARGSGSSGDAIRENNQTDVAAYLGFGTAVEYSLYNDQGTARIPARPHIGMNDKHLDGMVERVADYVMKQLARG